MCNHEITVETKKIVQPVRCKPYTMRFTMCNDCGTVFATTKQRRKNRKNFNQAYKKYYLETQTHGIYA